MIGEYVYKVYREVVNDPHWKYISRAGHFLLYKFLSPDFIYKIKIKEQNALKLYLVKEDEYERWLEDKIQLLKE